MRFVAIDIETANPDMSSICQIGIAEFYDGNLIGEWSTLIDPEDYFDEVNISIHGIELRKLCGDLCKVGICGGRMCNIIGFE